MNLKNKIIKIDQQVIKGKLPCDSLVFCIECGNIKYKKVWYDYPMPERYKKDFSSGLCPIHFDEAMKRLEDHRKIKGAYVNE